MADAHAVAHDDAHPPELRHHFTDLAAQREASTLAMWIFLVTEVLFFGGMFTAYVVYRSTYRHAFEGASNLLDLTLGTVNTAVLLCSSLTMALSVWASGAGKKKATILFLVGTILLGGVFLGIKAVEYTQKFQHHEVPGPHFVVPLDEDGVRRAARYLLDEGVDAIAISLMHSYVNPAHEERISWCGRRSWR